MNSSLPSVDLSFLDPGPNNKPGYRWCYCGVRCKPRKWVSKATYFAHAKKLSTKARDAVEAMEASGSTLHNHSQDAPWQQPRLVSEATVNSSGPSGTLNTMFDDNDGMLPIHDNLSEDDFAMEDVHARSELINIDQEAAQVDGVPAGFPHASESGGGNRNDGDIPRDHQTVGFNASDHELRPDDFDADAELQRLAALHIQDEGDTIGNATHTVPEYDAPDGRASMPKLAEAQSIRTFIEALENATLDDGGLPEDVIARLRTPLTEVIDLDKDSESALAFALEAYLRLDNAANNQYEGIQKLLMKYFDIEIPSLAEVKREAARISGIVPIYTDCCINSCSAYTAHRSELEQCPECQEPRFELRNGKKVSRKQMVTIPVGPQIQAAYRSQESAEAMGYRARCTEKVLSELKDSSDLNLPAYSDFIHGTQYLEACLGERITEHDTLLMFSIDGAQLYRMKESDCWVYIWVLLDRAPDNRYKNKHILIGGIIPGPRKPKVLESFLFPGFYHVAALMKEGFRIWNASTGEVFHSRVFVPFFLGDGPGITLLSGLVGHSGAFGCRLYCPMRGRHKLGAGGHYYPACKRPLDTGPVHAGSQHPDVKVNDSSFFDTSAMVQRYNVNVLRVRGAATQRTYEKLRKETGIVKESLVTGFPHDRIFSSPSCFPADIMHLGALNMTDLFVGLLRGTLQCSSPDHVSTWDWAIFADQTTWKTHGAAVAATKPYLPGSFDRPPRNIAEKLTSGYKAIEFLTWMYGLCPALLYGILPTKYWSNLCKLVRGFRLLYQYTIRTEEIREAHKLLVEFISEFEDLYYQRKSSRLHFVRQSVHALVHLASETINTGPYIIKSQWPIERTIGILGSQIRQPSNPFANIGQRAVRWAQMSALKHMFPHMDPDAGKTHLPRGAHSLPSSFALLRYTDPTDQPPYELPEAEATALRTLLDCMPRIQRTAAWRKNPTIQRWARLRLPNGQIARGWRETSTPLDHRRTSRNVKLFRNGRVEIGEVRYYFLLTVKDQDGDGETHSEGFAMASIYTPPNAELLAQSFQTFWSCKHTGDDGLTVIRVQDIMSAVAMIPHPGHVPELHDTFYLVEKLGLEVGVLAGVVEDAHIDNQ